MFHWFKLLIKVLSIELSMLLFCEPTVPPSLTLDIHISIFKLFKFLRPHSFICFHMMVNQNIRHGRTHYLYKYYNIYYKCYTNSVNVHYKCEESCTASCVCVFSLDRVISETEAQTGWYVSMYTQACTCLWKQCVCMMRIRYTPPK